MKNDKSKLYSLLIVLVIIVFSGELYSYPATYSSKPIEAIVVDSDTNEPIKGVIVIAGWHLERDNWHGETPLGFLELMETVTEKDGKFRFPGWGPKIVSLPVSWLIRMPPDSPHLIFYKKGYKPNILRNGYSYSREYPSMRDSKWNGQEIPLEKSDSNSREMIGRIRDELSRGFGRYHGPYREEMECGWRKLPRYYAAIAELSGGSYQLDKDLYRGYEKGDWPSKCGSYGSFIKKQYYHQIFYGIKSDDFRERLTRVDTKEILREIREKTSEEPLDIEISVQKLNCMIYWYGCSLNGKAKKYSESEAEIEVIQGARIQKFKVDDSISGWRNFAPSISQPGLYPLLVRNIDDEQDIITREYIFSAYRWGWDRYWY